MSAANQVAEWVGDADDGSTFVIRQYADLTLTAERKLDGVYTGEVTLRAATVATVTP